MYFSTVKDVFKYLLQLLHYAAFVFITIFSCIALHPPFTHLHICIYLVRWQLVIGWNVDIKEVMCSIDGACCTHFTSTCVLVYLFVVTEYNGRACMNI